MSDFNRHRDQIIERDFINPESAYANNDASTSELAAKIIRRWYIVLSIFLIVSLIGIPLIWIFKKPVYDVVGAIRVAPILTNILSGEADSGELGSINAFMNTQTQIITSNRVVQRVADDLAKKDISLFKDRAQGVDDKPKQLINETETKPEISAVLKQAISNDIIAVQTRNNTELIEVSMKSHNPEEATKIVDSFIQEYMAVEVSKSTKGEDQKLNILEDEQKTVAEKMQQARKAIHKLAQEYGDTKLDSRHQMKLDRISSLLASLTQYEADRIRLEAKVQLLEQNKGGITIGTEKMLQMRNQHINANPSVNSLINNIENIEQNLIVARQIMTPTNPEIKRRVELIELLNKRLDAKKTESGKEYDKLVKERLTQNADTDLNIAHSELKTVKVYEQRFRDILSKEDTETIGLGRKQLAIQELQDDLAIMKQLYAIITRRINDLDMERKRPARISVAYDAEIASVSDKKVKYSIAVIFGAMACGVGVTLLIATADRSIYVPSDITKNVSIRIIGTTTCVDRMEKSLLPRLLAEDYQTIRANIGSIHNNGDPLPKKLIITSPGIGEGKTTLAINLATSLAKSGKKVLLIDGDMRRPSVAHSLKLPKEISGLQDFLLGTELGNAVYRMPFAKLEILASDSVNITDAYELLASPLTPKYINFACDGYDHVIIDTPPVLAFPDALLWAKMADAAILASFAGKTTGYDLSQTTERLAQINIEVLGTVMNNVRAGKGYNRYNHNYYYAQKNKDSYNNKQHNKKIPLLAEYTEKKKDYSNKHKPFTVI